GLLELSSPALRALRWRAQAGCGVLWRECSTGPGAHIDGSPDAGRRHAGGRLLAHGVFGLSLRTGGGTGRQTDRCGESRSHAGGRATDAEGDADMLGGAGVPAATHPRRESPASRQHYSNSVMACSSPVFSSKSKISRSSRICFVEVVPVSGTTSLCVR